MKPEGCFSKKINKLNKPPGRLTKEQRTFL